MRMPGGTRSPRRRPMSDAGSPTAKAIDGAIETAIAGDSSYPERAAFVDADSPHAGREIARALDDGYAVVLVSADERERIITAKTLAASA